MGKETFGPVLPVEGEGGAAHDERVRDLFTRTALPQALTDVDGRFVMANAAYCELMGHSDLDLSRRTFDDVTHPADRARQRRAIRQLLEGSHDVVQVAKRYLRDDGTEIPCTLTLAVVRDQQAAVRYVHGSIDEVRTPAPSEAPRRTSAVDGDGPSPLELARRPVSRALAASASGRVEVALVRLGGLEDVAGVIGWEGVEAAHREARQRISAASPGTIGTVALVGISDLLVVAHDTAVMGLGPLLQAALGAPLSLGGFSMPLSATIGITRGVVGDDPAVLLRQARSALNHAVRTAFPEVTYDPSLDARTLADFALTLEIASALVADELALHYQPKVSLRDGSLVGAEALLRWEHPDHGWVSPARVVALAETAGLAAPLTCWVIDSAVAQAARWLRAGTPLPVAINVSPQVLPNPILPLRLSQALTRHQVPTRLVELEITETALATEPRAVSAVRQLAQLGFRIHLDDFGTGYSSLASIKSLPLSSIKVDKAFVRDLTASTRDRDLLAAIIGIAHQLGAQVVAEGVEQPEVLEALEQLGCDQAQGFLLGRPAAASELDHRLAGG